MKRLAAAIFILILLFNLVGYRFIAAYLLHRSDISLQARLDIHSYQESQLIELKVPLQIAYQSNETGYERYDGEISMDGITYKYVKRKLSNDTLYLKCIPDVKKMQLKEAENDYFNNTNDLSSKKSDHSKSFSIKKLLTEYNAHDYILPANQQSYHHKHFRIRDVGRTSASPHISPEQPPDLTV